MSNIVPLHPPKQGQEETARLVRAAGIKDAVALLGVRGYYRDSLGDEGHNDRGIYDDAILLLAPECYMTFNANCDPSHFKSGIANLIPGVWRYKIGLHNKFKPKAKQYTALVQAEPVVIRRDGERGRRRGWFGINIHRGSWTSTSSAGCQTIYPSQWESFITTVKAQMMKHEQSTIPYLLVDRSG